ncbi:MAG: bifunctional aldolase/short-chain dehydrogenase [Deinococcus sp.]
MRNLWNEEEARGFVERYGTQGVSEDLALRTYSSRLLGAEPRLVLHGGGNTSVKTTMRDVFGDEVRVVCVKGSGRDLRDIEPAGHPAVRLEALFRLRSFERLSDEDMVNAVRQNLLDSQAPTPSIETLLHAYLPHKFVDHTHAVSATVLANQHGGEARCAALFGGRVAWVPYVMPGFGLAQAAADIYDAAPGVQGLLLARHGLFTMADTAREAYDLMVEFVSLIEEEVARHGRLPASFAPVAPPAEVARPAELLPRLRGMLGRLAPPGVPQHWLLDLQADERLLTFAGGVGLADYASRGVATPEHVLRMKRLPALLPCPDARDLEGWTREAGRVLEHYAEAYHASFGRYNARADGTKRELDPLPRVLVIPHVGVVGVGRSAAESAISSDVARAWSEAVMDAESIGRYQPLNEEQHFEMEYWSLEQAKLGGSSPRPFAGQVVVVTGGGSGIGAATARAFHAQGAEVAVLDRDAQAAGRVAAGLGPRALALACDVTDEAGVERALDDVAARFGGVDVVVSNAGVALGGSMLSIPSETLRRSFEVNFFGHQFVARAAVRLMRLQELGGVLLFNVSKQAVNPGPDFGAYGTSKAALLALVRQYALEHGRDRIRVNAVNADRIRSGLLDDELIARRARARGLSEAEYMAGNLLHQEVRAEDVAQAFVASSTLRRTTGDVTTVDGGNVAAMLR